MKYFPEDQSFNKLITRIKSLPEETKKRVRKHLEDQVAPPTLGSKITNEAIQE